MELPLSVREKSSASKVSFDGLCASGCTMHIGGDARASTTKEAQYVEPSIPLTGKAGRTVELGRSAIFKALQKEVASVIGNTQSEQKYLGGIYELARCYGEGFGCPRDAVQYRKYLKVAAEKGHFESMKLLVKCLRKGLGGPINIKEAFAWETKAFKNLQQRIEAIEQKSSDDDCKQLEPLVKAQLFYQYARFWDKAYGCKHSVYWAIHYYKQAATLGMPEAYEMLAYCSKVGKGLPQDFDVAVDYFWQAGELGSIYGKRGFIHCCLFKNISQCDKRFKIAERYLGELANSMCPTELMRMFEEIGGSFRATKEGLAFLKKYEKAYPWLRWHLGLHYLQAKDKTVRNSKEGIRLIESAEKDGSILARFRLARVYSEGTAEVKVNNALAIELLYRIPKDACGVRFSASRDQWIQKLEELLSRKSWVLQKAKWLLACLPVFRQSA